MTAPTEEELLAGCAAEPIHLPGAIQPHGALLACTEPDLTVVQVSANTGAVFGRAPDDLLGAALGEVLPAPALDELFGPETDAVAERTPIGVVLEGRTYDVFAHRRGGVLIVELEPGDGHDGEGLYPGLRRALRRLQQATSLPALSGALAAEVRRLTGFDRVMVYRFDAEWNGEVIGEAVADGVESFLGLRYPASDIPPQARALYLESWIRLIADVEYEPVPLVGAAEPLDLGLAALRSVSPVHRQYLRNMGVAASMSVSLVDGGRLWGLVACHHESGPHRPSQRVRAAAELLGQTGSLLLTATEGPEAYEHAIAVGAGVARLLDALSTARGSLAEALTADPAPLLELTGATGAAVRMGDTLVTAGETPDEAMLADILGWLRWQGRQLVAVDSLARADGRFESLKDVASGVLGVRLSGRGESWVVWFRPEVLRTVEWGGDPSAHGVDVDERGVARLSPRSSFARWTEEVRLRSRPWSEEEQGAARQVGEHLDRVIVRQAEERAELSATLQGALLLEELPDVPGASLAARYRPAGDSPIGGDWYDLFFLPDGRTALALGDVAGHGVAVAPIMAQLRHALRAYLLQEGSPASAIERLGELLDWLLPTELASLVVADFAPGAGRLRVANAGHLPPLLVEPGGAARLIAVDRGPALGVGRAVSYADTTVELPRGASIVLYTDGLVERRGEPLDQSLERLVRVASGAAADLEALCDRLVAAAPGSDDVTLLALRSEA